MGISVEAKGMTEIGRPGAHRVKGLGCVPSRV